MSAPASGWGELKQATVLFADIVSSTEQIAQLDPEEAMDRLQPAVTLMCEAVERFGGTVIRTLGDGVMALFGVPNALEGHTRLACEAALHMQQGMARNRGGLSIRVGLHCGLVASDPHAHDTGKGGGAHGLTIHLASRVVGVAPPGGVTMTQDCHALVQAFVEVDSLGHPPLKGIAEPVEIFRLRALKPAFASQYFQQAKLTPFRGREKEMALLQQAQRLTEVADAQVIGVSGGPGAGKSRLCYEFTQWCRARGKPVFEVRAQLYGSATPLQPVLELMRTFFFGIVAGDAAAVAREKITARLAQLQSAQPGDPELLCEFLGVAASDSDLVAAVPPKMRRSRLLAIVSELMKHSSGTFAVILIEDMHWLDEASEEFVAALVDAISATRTMVLLNYRPSYRSPWAGRENFREIEIGELSAADTEAIVRELINHRREFQDISQLIVRRSGGNPFFAEELVRSLAERGVLSGEPDHGAKGVESVERALPATVQAVIGARIDRLHESEKSMLQMCAIIGKDVPLAILERVAGAPRRQLERVLDALCQAELIQPQPAAGGRRFAFRHPLIQEVAYGSQLKAKRTGIHLAAAQAMQAFYEDRINEYAALIAHHFEQAGRPLDAANYNAQAATWLGSTYAAQAIRHWHKVRSLIDKGQGDADALRLRATAGAKIALLGWHEGMALDAVQPLIEESLQFANQADDRLVLWLLVIEGRMLVAGGGSADEYVSRVKKAMLYVDLDRDWGRVAVVNAFLSQAYSWAGLLREALEASSTALAHVDRVEPFDRAFIGFSVEQWVLSVRSRLLARMGRFSQARECLEKLTRLEAASIEAPVPCMTNVGYVELAWASRNVPLAQSHGRNLPELAKKHGTAYIATFAHSYAAIAAMLAGEHGDALESFGTALALLRETGAAREFEPELLACLAECRLYLGDPSAAHACANEAVELSRARTTRVAECRALIVRGQAALALGLGRACAEDDFARAEALIEVTGAQVCRAALDAARAFSAEPEV